MIKIIAPLKIAAVLTALTASGAFATLNLEGQSGVFLNALAYPIAASKTAVSSHYVNLDSNGAVATYSLAFGLKSNVELGYTRISSNVSGVNDQNVFLGKWQFAPETKSSPAVAVWGIYRNVQSDSSSPDFGVTATKIVTVANKPLALSVGLRNTKAQGLGLFGFAPDREWKLEGSAALFVKPNIAIGTEFKQQVNGKTWTDVAFRYIASNGWNFDAGIANLDNALDNQFALAVTRIF